MTAPSSDPQRLRVICEQLGLEPPVPMTLEEAAAAATARRIRYEQEHEAQEAHLGEHLSACGVGVETIAAVRALEDTMPVREVASWAASQDVFLLLLGKPGTGKTVAAATALRSARVLWREDEMVRWRYSHLVGLFTHARDLVRSMHGNGELLERAQRVAWLVVDELGSEYADQGERWLAEVDGLLGVRLEKQRRTVITSNLGWDEFRQRYGDRIRSRIKGRGRVVTTGITDRRLAP